jgi:hypothetical protein
VRSEQPGGVASGTIPKDISGWAGAARLISPDESAALTITNGASNWRFEGIQIEGGPRGASIVNVGEKTAQREELPANVWFSKVAVLGHPSGTNRRGLTLTADGVLVDGCYIGRMILGPDAESQAVASFTGVGNYYVRHSYLEAAGENFMIGARRPLRPGHVKENVVFEHCIMQKDLSWAGHPKLGIVKNLGEFKRVRNGKLLGCLFHTSWGPSGGAGLVATVRCEHGKNPWNVIDGLLIENCYVTHTVGSLGILGRDNASKFLGEAKNITVRNCLFHPCRNARTSPKRPTSGIII